MTDRDNLKRLVDRLIELEKALKTAEEKAKKAETKAAYYEKQYEKAEALIMRKYKYYVDSSYLLDAARQYGIDWRAMERLLSDYFGLDGKGGHGRE